MRLPLRTSIRRLVQSVAALALFGFASPEECGDDGCSGEPRPAVIVFVYNPEPGAPALDQRLTVTLRRDSDTTRVLTPRRGPAIADANAVQFELPQAQLGRYQLVVSHPDYVTHVQDDVHVLSESLECLRYRTFRASVLLQPAATP